MNEYEYRNCRREGDTITGEKRLNVDPSDSPWYRFEGTLDLLRINEALFTNDESFGRIWDLQDGYGEAGFTPPQGYDWSGIRDSSPEGRARMDEVAREYVTDADLMELFGLPSDATLAQALLDALKGATDDESPDDTAIAEAESAICERLAISLDETELGLTRDAVERIEAFVSAHATGVTNWTYQDAGFLGVEADGVR